MTAKQVMEQGWRAPHVGKTEATVGEVRWRLTWSKERFDLIGWALEARRLNLKTADRRYRVRRGLPLTGSWTAVKAAVRGRNV